MKDNINRLHKMNYSNKRLARELNISIKKLKEIKEQRPNLSKKIHLQLRSIIRDHNLKKKQELE